MSQYTTYIKKSARRMVMCICLAMIGHTGMDAFKASYPIFGAVWLQRTAVDAWAMWIALEGWTVLVWAVKGENGNGERR